jgi:hypothetical protein
VLRRLRILDLLAVTLSLAVVGILSVHAYGGSTGGLVRIDSQSGPEIYPLDQPRTIKVSGPIGTDVIEIRDGAARVVEADCRDKVCIAMGAISRPGAWVACLPNRVFLRVLGTDAAADALSY